MSSLILPLNFRSATADSLANLCGNFLTDVFSICLFDFTVYCIYADTRLS